MYKYWIYTDGGTRNTGTYKGGHVKPTDLCAYAYKVVNVQTGKFIYGSQAYMGYTNNQMEVMGVIKALLRLVNMMGFKDGQHFSKQIQFKVISDSKYVDNTVNDGRLANKAKTGFNMANGNEWKDLYSLLKFFPNISFHWVKGHATNQGNIYVDHKLNHAMDIKAQNRNKTVSLEG